MDSSCTKLIVECRFSINCLPTQKLIASYAPRGKCVPCTLQVTLFAFRYHMIFFYLSSHCDQNWQKICGSFSLKRVQSNLIRKERSFLAENMTKIMRSHKEIKHSSKKLKSDCTDIQLIFFHKSISVFLDIAKKKKRLFTMLPIELNEWMRVLF